MNKIYAVGTVFLFLLIIVAVSLIRLLDKDDGLRVAYGKVGLVVVGIIMAAFLVFLVVF